MREKLNGELVILALVGVFSLILLFQTYSYPYVAAQFPRLISVITLVLAVYTLIASLVRGAGAGPKKAAGQASGGLPWYASTALMLAAVGLIYLVDFKLAVFLVLTGLPLLLGERSTLKIIAIALVSTIVLAVALEYGFGISLPPGILFS